MSGLLIVNADDLGRDRATTDAILECWRARRISSATAMVWMEDSERAARLALEAELPTGLHLNLVEPFTGAEVPPAVRARQAAVAHHYREARSRIRALLYDPRAQRAVDAAIADQLGRFRELYGREPTHVDGHHHSHITPNALLSRALPREIRVRCSFTFLPGERSAASRALRRVRNGLIAHRFRTTDWLFDLREMHPAFGGDELERKLGLARGDSVEVMAHPGAADELELMMGDEWGAEMERRGPRSFAALAGR